MTRNIWTIVILIGGLILVSSARELSARGIGGGGGGGAPHGGGGGAPHLGGGGPHIGGGGGPHLGGGGAPHIAQPAPRVVNPAPHLSSPAPHIAGPAPHLGSGAGMGRQPFINRSPSFSSPNLGTHGLGPSAGISGHGSAGGQAGVNAHPGFTYRPHLAPGAGAGIGNHSAVGGTGPHAIGPAAGAGVARGARSGVSAAAQGGVSSAPHIGAETNSGITGRSGLGGNVGLMNRSGIAGGTAGRSPVSGAAVGGAATVNRAGIGNRTLGGSQINVGNHAVNIASTNYSPSFAAHPGIYHGYWNGNSGRGWGGGWGWGGYGPYGGFGYGYGPYGWGGYWGRPFGWGLGAWGLGALLYNSGYLGYYNPYWGSGYGGGGYNYSQPIPVDYGNTYAASGADASSADDLLNAAIAAFKQADYDSALDIADRAISQFPSDAVLHEFRALVLFAKGDYRQAAATLHSVLAIGPGWDWTTMSRLYPDISVYAGQLRALEGTVRQNPQDAPARFVLAYHYMTAGHGDAAAKQLDQVVQLVSNDRVASDLLRMLRPPQSPTSSPGAPGPTPQPPAEDSNIANPNVVPGTPNTNVTPVDPQNLIGSWKASREDGSAFELNLTEGQTFTWKFTAPKQEPRDLSGKYTVEQNVLALQQKDGGSLVGQVTPKGAGAFNFKMLGAPKEDPGLDFSRQ